MSVFFVLCLLCTNTCHGLQSPASDEDLDAGRAESDQHTQDLTTEADADAPSDDGPENDGLSETGDDSTSKLREQNHQKIQRILRQTTQQFPHLQASLFKAAADLKSHPFMPMEKMHQGAADAKEDDEEAGRFKDFPTCERYDDRVGVLSRRLAYHIANVDMTLLKHRGVAKCKKKLVEELACAADELLYYKEHLLNGSDALFPTVTENDKNGYGHLRVKCPKDVAKASGFGHTKRHRHWKWAVMKAQKGLPDGELKQLGYATSGEITAISVVADEELLMSGVADEMKSFVVAASKILQLVDGKDSNLISILYEVLNDEISPRSIAFLLDVPQYFAEDLLKKTVTMTGSSDSTQHGSLSDMLTAVEELNVSELSDEALQDPKVQKIVDNWEDTKLFLKDKCEMILAPLTVVEEGVKEYFSRSMTMSEEDFHLVFHIMTTQKISKEQLTKLLDDSDHLKQQLVMACGTTEKKLERVLNFLFEIVGDHGQLSLETLKGIMRGDKAVVSRITHQVETVLTRELKDLLSSRKARAQDQLTGLISQGVIEAGSSGLNLEESPHDRTQVVIQYLGDHLGFVVTEQEVMDAVEQGSRGPGKQASKIVAILKDRLDVETSVGAVATFLTHQFDKVKTMLVAYVKKTVEKLVESLMREKVPQWVDKMQGVTGADFGNVQKLNSLAEDLLEYKNQVTKGLGKFQKMIKDLADEEVDLAARDDEMTEYTKKSYMLLLYVMFVYFMVMKEYNMPNNWLKAIVKIFQGEQNLWDFIFGNGDYDTDPMTSSKNEALLAGTELLQLARDEPLTGVVAADALVYHVRDSMQLMIGVKQVDIRDALAKNDTYSGWPFAVEIDKSKHFPVEKWRLTFAERTISYLGIAIFLLKFATRMIAWQKFGSDGLSGKYALNSQLGKKLGQGDWYSRTDFWGLMPLFCLLLFVWIRIPFVINVAVKNMKLNEDEPGWRVDMSMVVFDVMVFLNLFTYMFQAILDGFGIESPEKMADITKQYNEKHPKVHTKEMWVSKQYATDLIQIGITSTKNRMRSKLYREQIKVKAFLKYPRDREARAQFVKERMSDFFKKHEQDYRCPQDALDEIMTEFWSNSNSDRDVYALQDWIVASTMQQLCENTHSFSHYEFIRKMIKETETIFHKIVTILSFISILNIQEQEKMAKSAAAEAKADDETVENEQSVKDQLRLLMARQEALERIAHTSGAQWGNTLVQPRASDAAMFVKPDSSPDIAVVLEPVMTSRDPIQVAAEHTKPAEAVNTQGWQNHEEPTGSTTNAAVATAAAAEAAPPGQPRPEATVEAVHPARKEGKKKYWGPGHDDRALMQADQALMQTGTRVKTKFWGPGGYGMDKNGKFWGPGPASSGSPRSFPSDGHERDKESARVARPGFNKVSSDVAASDSYVYV